MQNIDVDVNGLEAAMADIDTLTVEQLKCFVPIPGDMIHLVRGTMSTTTTGWIPEAQWLKTPVLGPSLKCVVQEEPCCNVMVQGDWLLHHACAKGASAEILQYIIQTDPQAAQHVTLSKHGEQQLPLHIFMRLDQRYPCAQSVRVLVEAYPKALEIMDLSGFLPLHYACWNEHITMDILRYFVSQYPQALSRRGGYFAELPLWYAMASGLSLSLLVVLLRPWPQALEASCLERAHDLYHDETLETLQHAAHAAQQELLLTQELAWLGPMHDQLEQLLLLPPTKKHQEDDDHACMDHCVVPVMQWIQTRIQQSRKALGDVSGWLDHLTEETDV